MTDKLTRLKEILGEVSDLGRAGAVLAWDQETFMPPGGIENRADQLTTLQKLSHSRFTSDDVGTLLDAAEGEVARLPFDSDDASVVRVTRRDYEQARKLSLELVGEIARAGATARPVWQKAREEQDFSLFAPYLERNVELNRRVADALGYKKRPYDALLDRTEPGLTTDQLEEIFDELRQGNLPPVAQTPRHPAPVASRVHHRGCAPERPVAAAAGAGHAWG